MSLSLEHQEAVKWKEREHSSRRTADLRTKILDSRGLDSSRILILRGGILMSIGSSPESLSQQILVGIINLSREIGRNSTARCTKLDTVIPQSC